MIFNWRKTRNIKRKMFIGQKLVLKQLFGHANLKMFLIIMPHYLMNVYINAWTWKKSKRIHYSAKFHISEKFSWHDVKALQKTVNFISSTQHDIMFCINMMLLLVLKWGRCSFKPFEHKGKKILTAYKVHFQCQEVKMGRFRVKVLCGNLWQHW